MLAKFGFLGAAGLILGILITMIAAGWLLSSLVWLVRRRHTAAPGPAPIGEPSQHPLAGFTWTEEPPRGG
ncbi:MYXO-CTERM sorting domain-containing protein [Streptomyces sp. NPDC102270]|uniref:MYXO-CTERM sorting domain-containing protein n=1 Tax=Streptomyces sp. NPDC102270 TaxID=3366150 RepID=UPI0037F5A5EA